MSDQPRSPLTVVVPTRDRANLLTGCLVALRASLRPDDELLVVDSASTDPSIPGIAAEFGAGYLRCRAPGASLARNTGWRAARHQLVAFVDDDVRVEPQWADALARAADDFPGAAFVTGRIGWPADNRPEYPLALKLDEESSWIEASTPNPIGHTANVVIRMSALERVGGFDEILGAGAKLRAAEDQDLFDRLFAAGYRGRYEPVASAAHIGWRERHDILKLEWSYGVGTGARLVKVAKSNRGRVGKVMRENVWAFVREIFHSIRVRYKFMIAVSIVRLAGTIVGVVRAMPRSVRDGHFRKRRRETTGSAFHTDAASSD